MRRAIKLRLCRGSVACKVRGEIASLELLEQQKQGFSVARKLEFPSEDYIMSKTHYRYRLTCTVQASAWIRAWSQFVGVITTLVAETHGLQSKGAV